MKKIIFMFLFVGALIFPASAIGDEVTIDYDLSTSIIDDQYVQELKVFGNVPVEFAGKRIGLSILYPNVEITDQIENNLKFAALYQDFIKPDGSFEFEFLFNVSEGEYTIIIKVDTFKDIYTKKVYITSIMDYVELINAINNKSLSSEELLDVFLESADNLNLDTEIFKLLTENEQLSICSRIINSNTNYSIENFSNSFDNIVLITVMNTSKDVAIFAKTLEHYDSKYIRLSEVSEFQYYNSGNKAKVLSLMYSIKGNFEDVEDIIAAFIDSLVLADFKLISFDTQLYDILNRYKDHLTIENSLIRYENLIESSKRLISKYVLDKNKDINTAKNLKDTFIYAVDNIDKLIRDNNSDTGNSSKDPGKGRTGSTNLIIDPAINKVETQKTIEDDSFKDLVGIDWAEDAILELYNKGIVSGKEKGKFYPNDSITRAEFIKILMDSLKLTNESAKCDYQDVNENDWYYKYVASGSQTGIIKGISVQLFAPNERLTREDICVLLYRVITYLDKAEAVKKISNDINDYEEISSYAKNSVLMLFNYEIIKGYEDKTFRPKNNLTRAEAAVLVRNLLEYLKL